MIAAQDANNISRLLKQLSRDSSTENVIAFMADNGGMLQSCQKILALCREGREESIQWVQKECAEHGVQYPWFLQEAGQILQLFQPDDAKEDNYEVLGLSSAASLAEVKRAYRRLSVQYHPDSVGTADPNTTKKFIHINKAYHTLTNIQNQESSDDASARRSHVWHYGKTKSVPGRVNAKLILWISVLILSSILSCVLISRIYSQKVMLSTLKQSAAAFVPPTKKSQASAPVVAMTFAEKMRIAETLEKAQQAARKQETEAVDKKRAESVAQVKPKVIKEKSPDQLDKENSLPPKEVVQTMPVAGVAVNSQKTPPPEPTKQTAALQSVETKVDKAKAKTVHEEGDATRKNTVAVVAVDSQKTPPPEPAKQAAALQSVEIKVDKAKAKIVHEEGDATNKKTIATTKRTIPPDLRKETPLATATPAVQRISQHDEQPKSGPPSAAVKQEVEVQAVVEPPQLQETARMDVDSEEVQQRIDTFLADYCRAYGDKNLMAFTRFFELDATENGQLVADIMDTYTKLFESTKDIALQILTLKWEESSKGQITLNGRFKIDLVYQNEEAVHARGKIDFLLVDGHGTLHVQQVSYSFDQ